MKKPHEVLIAEDDRLLLKILKDRFLRENCNVTEATDGNQVLEQVKLKRFHVILLDLMMPGKTGIEVLKELKGKKGIPPIVALTNFPKEFVRAKVLALGAVEYLVKSEVKLDEIVKVTCHVCYECHGKKK